MTTPTIAIGWRNLPEVLKQRYAEAISRSEPDADNQVIASFAWKVCGLADG